MSSEMVGRNAGIGNVNFDYSGPPVSVSNKMALDLVTQFGMQNAWYAFLKLRGLSPSKGDVEKALALKRFRNRIRQLRRSADNLRDRAEELNSFMGVEFNAALAESTTISTTENSTSSIIENAANAGQAANDNISTNGDDVPESGDEKDDADGLGKLVIDEDVSFSTSSATSPTKFSATIPESISSVLNKLKTSSAASRQSSTDSTQPSAIQAVATANVSPATTNVNPSIASTSSATPTATTVSNASPLTSPPTTTKETIAIATTTTGAAGSTTATTTTDSMIARRHRETIEDVVSSVMAKIRNNEPFEGEALLSGGSSSSVASSSIGTAAHTTTASSTVPKSRAKSKNVFVKQQPPSSISSEAHNSSQQSHLVTHFVSGPASTQQQQAHHQFSAAPASSAGSATLVDSSTGTIVTFPSSESEHLTTAFGGQLGNLGLSNASTVCHQSIAPDQVTILSNFTEIIRASTSSSQQQISSPQLTPVTKIVTHSSRGDVSTIPQQHVQQQHIQQQQITQLPAGSTIQFPGFSLPLSATATAGGIPIGISPQGTITLPNNITVQSLLQSLQQQAKKQQLVQLAQFQLGGQPGQQQPIQLQLQQQVGGIQQAAILQAQPQQQILPDSSSQDIGGSSVATGGVVASHGGPVQSQAGQTMATAFAPMTASENASNAATGKATKKRQYVRRKNVTGKNNESETVSNTEKAPVTQAPVETAKVGASLSAQTSGNAAGSGTVPASVEASQASPKTSGGSSPLKTSGKKPSTKIPPTAIAAPTPAIAADHDADLETEEKTPTTKRAYIKKGSIKKSEAEISTTPSATPKASAKNLDGKPVTSAKTEPVSAKSAAKTQSKISSEADAAKIEDLESQLSKCQRQLNAERNKSAGQKKRIEKLQSELEKNIDAIQLVQIDLACQKTDNNNLTAENIALKAELQKARTKNETKFIKNTKPVGRKPKEPVTSNASASSSSSKEAKAQPRAGAKRQATATAGPSTAKHEDEEKEDPISLDEPIEFGRRQSKRICVARKNFLYQTY